MMGDPQTAEILLDTPEVVVETAADDDTVKSVKLVGTMFADGLNANAWGLTERGAKAIASSIEGEDLTAGHPPVVGYGFTRSIHDGPGKPIGSVTSSDVQYFEGAKMAASGGGYTADYEADVTSPGYAGDFEKGLMIGGDYGVSIGITAADEDAVCSIDGENFAECKHFRGEEVDGKIAGPLYNDGEADHLAVVYVPAWEESDAEVTEANAANQAMLASNADEFFGEPFDNKETDRDPGLAGESTEDVQEGPEWAAGDLVECEAVPDVFGVVDHVEASRQVATINVHQEADGELVATGHTLTTDLDDLVPYRTADQQNDEDASADDEPAEASEGGDGRLNVTVTPEPEYTLQLQQ